MVALTPPDRVAAVRGDDEIARAASQLVDSLVREAATETTDVLRLAEQRHALRSRARARAQVELERRNRHRPDILVLDDVDEPSETPEAHRWGSLLRRALQLLYPSCTARRRALSGRQARALRCARSASELSEGRSAREAGSQLGVVPSLQRLRLRTAGTALTRGLRSLSQGQQHSSPRA